jgi:hypothetical protein
MEHYKYFMADGKVTYDMKLFKDPGLYRIVR